MKFFVTKVKIKLKKLCDKIFKNFGGYIFRYKSGLYRYKSEATVTLITIFFKLKIFIKILSKYLFIFICIS